jgi:hypothetical protein
MWEKLVRISLLGTDRASLDAADRKKLEKLLGFPLSEDPAEELIQSLALVGFLRRTALLPKKAPLKVEIPAPRPDNRKRVPQSVGRQLQDMLRGSYSNFLGEALRFLRRHHFALPPESLPLVLDKALEDPDLYQLAFDNLHPADAWLARQHPNWRNLAPLPPFPEHETDPDLRLATYRALRKNQTDPVDLEKRWNGLSPEKKVFFLRAFDPPFSDWDLFFLQNCLEDSRKPVRRAAAQLLLRDPGTKLATRWKKWLKSWIQFDHNGIRWMPEKAEQTPWDHLGLWKSKPTEQITWVAQNTPPQMWESLMIKPLASQIVSISRARFGKAWMKGLLEAVLDHRSSSLAATLLKIHKSEDLGFARATVRSLIQRLSPMDWLELSSEEARRNSGLISDNSLAFDLLLYGEHPWPSGLVRSVLGPFQEWMLTASQINWGVWHYRKLLRAAAFHMEPRALPLWEKGWPDYGYIWGQWEADIGHFQNILRFRKQFYQDLIPILNE